MNSGRSCILTYHSVDVSGSVISVSPQMFRQHMDYLKRTSARVLPLEEIQASSGAVSLTFDDGFRNFMEFALPVLREYQFPATVFAVSGYCGATNTWPSQPVRPRIPRLDLMSWSELEEAAKAGVRIEAHTVTHPFLSHLSEAQIEEELSQSRRSIEDRTGRPVTAFAYPYGDRSIRVKEAVSRHFSVACGTTLGFISKDSDRLELPRLDVFYLQRRIYFESLQGPYGAAYIAARGALRGLRHWADFR